MADDRGFPPTPRPRRRRTDIDPNAPSPPVAHERRGGRRPTDGSPTLGERWLSDDAPTTARDVAVSAVGPGVAMDSQRDRRPGAAFEGSGAVATAAPVVAATFHVPGVEPETTEVPPPGAETDAAPIEPAPDHRSWLGALEDRSPDPTICPFLRAIGEHGLGAPIGAPDAANRCAALAEAVPQSLRQQQLVCLTTGHVNCPRYLRGAAVVAETPAPVVRAGRTMSPAMLGSLVVLVLALSASVGFVWARGGALDIGPTIASASPSAIAAASPSTAPASAPVVAPSASPSTSPSVSPTPAPTPAPSPSPTPAPTPTPTPDATPRSDRYALLTACPNTPRCFIYRVRAGDNLYSIARYFGVSLDSIYDRNPWLRSRGLRAGQELRLPPPTR